MRRPNLPPLPPDGPVGYAHVRETMKSTGGSRHADCRPGYRSCRLTGQLQPHWNDKGHMVVAELVCQRLSPEQCQAVVAMLSQHPHWNEYLIADRPENVPEEQWAFSHPATWPDWVKHHHEQFSHPKWHYVDFPFVPH